MAANSSAPAQSGSVRGGKQSKDRPGENKILPDSENRSVFDRFVDGGPRKEHSSGKAVKPKSSSKEVPSDPKKKISLRDYPQTKPVVEAILGANNKHLESPEKAQKKKSRIEEEDLFSPPRRTRDVSSSPSPARHTDQETSRKRPLSDRAKLLLDGTLEDNARDKMNDMNTQFMKFSRQPRSEDTQPRTEAKQSRYEDVLPPAPIPQMIMPQGFSSDLMAMLFMNAAQNLSGQSAAASNPKKNIIKIEQDSDANDEESDEDEAESPLASWSGLHSEFKNDGAAISDLAKDYWSSVNATDSRGRRDLSFKKPFKKANKTKFYTEGDDLVAFRPPQRNPELPKLEGYRLKEEEDLVSVQKGAGAAAAAACVAVDSLRDLIAEVQSSATDLANGAVKDPGQEAEYVCHSVIKMVEEGAIANIVQSIRFLGGAFAFCSFKRHMLALRQVTADDAKKVLSDSPPDNSWLFGVEIKDSVQKIRDSSLISRAFYARNTVGRGGYRNFGNRGGRGGKSSTTYVPRDRRFKGGRGFGFKKTRKFSYGGKDKERSDKSTKEKDE